ncbi:hypothetical protein EZJ19_00215 [Parasulfuritortus cantonensis]|uniref:Uncharacterized protein n=1 Tax=Parasulfuritortus cantonensis TaxID=2528202 RepID=A0A4R1BRT9_9PROT|nr:hypothetical protein [Parasulfuritortus cantonensis]TCJ20361.1 hypothetical protein EZJ19_00215 [Parasulfuritortus cantonensis]HWS78745.1 hypothetical protein [Thermomonas sp.]
MNLPQMSPDGAGHPRWLKIAAGVWLVLVSAIAIVDSVGLSRLIEQSRSSAQDAQMQALATRISDLEHQAEAAKRQPKPVVQGDFDAARQALEERLAHVEQAQATDAHGDDIKALQARVGVLEARLKSRALSATTSRKTAETAKPKVPEPPFNVVGLELRGGERFVSIASRGATALIDLRLLREGESIGAWQLQAIDAHAAVFRVDNQTVRLALP